MILIIVSILFLVAIATVLYMRQPQFGKAPTGARLERIKQSSNYRDGKFQNLMPTQLLPEGYTMAGEVYRTFLGQNPRKFPVDSLPSIRTDLKAIQKESDVMIWFGHSSYFLQVDGIRLLVDPVLMGSASPMPIGVRSFKGADIYSPEDLPEIDYLLISHDHFDHLDYKTIMALKSKIRYVICGLGVGEHFEHWGFESSQIIERDWDETVNIGEGYNIHAVPARHGSGRGFNRDNTLWLAFVIDAPNHKIYVGGDSGYGEHFVKHGDQFGPFDLVILDNGQYGEDWYSSIHMPPKFTLQAARDLRASRVLPVHSSKFVLSRHPWDEPLADITELSKSSNISVITPLIGETVHLNDSSQTFQNWWEGVR